MRVMNNTILSTAVVCGVRRWFFLPWWAANAVSSIDRYYNSLPSRPSPTPPRRRLILYNVFRFIPRLPRVVQQLLVIFWSPNSAFCRWFDCRFYVSRVLWDNFSLFAPFGRAYCNSNLTHYVHHQRHKLQNVSY